MTKNEKNELHYVEIEVTGFQQICNRLSTLENENEQLKKDNKIMSDELTYFKEYAADLEDKVKDLQKDSDCDLCIDCINCSEGLVDTSIWSTAGGA